MRPRPSSRGGASACGPEHVGRGGHEDDLLGPESRELFDQAEEAAGPIAEAMGFSPPVRVGRKSDRVRLGRQRNRQRGGDRVGQVAASHSREIQELGPSRVGLRGGRPPHQIAASRFADEREDEIAVGVQVVHRDQELAEAGLSQVVHQQLSVPTAQVVGSRLLQHAPRHAPGPT